MTTNTFLQSCFGPVDNRTYDKPSSGWRWVSWGNWGRAERWTKMLAYTIGTIGPFYLGNPFGSDTVDLPLLSLIAAWGLLLLSPVQLLDVYDRWMIGDRLSMAIMVPRVISHPLMGLTLLHTLPSDPLRTLVMAYAGLLLLSLFFEGMFLRRHLGREHVRPGIEGTAIFWAFLWIYIAIYMLVLVSVFF